MNEIELKKIKEEALNEHIPIIMDDTLKEIAILLKNRKLKHILEIGTAVGYSAICFSQFLEENGKIDTIEREEERASDKKQLSLTIKSSSFPQK